MPALSGIYAQDLVKFTSALGTESVTVVFDRSRMNMRREVETERAMQEGRIEAVVERIVDMVISWDVVDDQGTPVPLTAELLMDLPSKAVRALFEGMQEAGLPTSAEGNASSDTSSTPAQSSMVPQASPQNGPSPSTSPAPSTSPSPT